MDNPIIGLIYSGDRCYNLHLNGFISGKHVQPSGGWVMLGAIRCNNFGNRVEELTLLDIMCDFSLGKSLPWRNKNRTQKWHLTDFDHGSQRVWQNPKHDILFLPEMRGRVSEEVKRRAAAILPGKDSG